MNLSIHRNKFWLLAAAIFLLHQVNQVLLQRSLPFIDAYLDAFLSIPVLLGLALQERRWAIDRLFPSFSATNYRFSKLEVFVATLLLGVAFEEGLGRFWEGYTRDNWDYLAYLLGAVYFQLLINVRVYGDRDSAVAD